MTLLTSRFALAVSLSLSCMPMLLTACGDDETHVPSDGGAADALPTELEKGTVISWNPTLTVTSATELTYENKDGAGSAFTASIGDATYTYVLGVNGIATLTIDGTSAADGKLLSALPAKLVLTKGTGTALSVDIEGQTFGGSIVQPLPSGGGSGATAVTGTVPSGGTPASVADALVGSHELQFGYPQAGAPFKEGAQATFVVGADDTLTAMGKKISNPYTINGNAAAILWNDGKYVWEVTDNQGGVFNEINVMDAKTEAWLGQWADPSKFGSGSGGSDANKDVIVHVTSSGGNGNTTPPYQIGATLTVTWDGAMALTILDNGSGQSVTPAFVEETKNADGTRTLKFSDDADTDADGYRYFLTLDADDKITLLKAEHFVDGGFRVGSAGAVP